MAITFFSLEMAVIRCFCRRIAVMYRGKIVENGDTEAVITGSQHAYTRALLS